MKTRILLCLLTTVGLFNIRAGGEEPWLSESWAGADNLTSLDPDFQTDLSGAVWNPATRTLWLCRNKGPSKIWSLVEDGDGGFEIYCQGSDTGKWDNAGDGFGDAEGIAQADCSESNTVYVVVEDASAIKEYDLSTYGTAVLSNSWNIAAFIPSYDGELGPEGIAFVPDECLQAGGFVDTNGVPYTSTNGMGGLMFVAHQNGGRIYAFDLKRSDSTFGFVGAYKTGFSESCGLEFDRSNCVLYVCHGIDAGNYTNKLEAVSLGSYPSGGERVLSNLAVYEMPGAVDANIEGIALTPRIPSASEHWIFLTQDDGGSESLMWFTEFTTNSRSACLRVNAGTDDAEEFYDTTMYLDSSDLELIYDANPARSNQTVGIRFSNVPIPDGATITNAYVQFTCKSTNGETPVTLTIKGEATDSAPTFSGSAGNISSRSNTTASVEWTPPGWLDNQATTNERTPDLSEIMQEIVDRPAWSNGNSLAFVIAGNDGGLRSAWAYNEVSPEKAPLLYCAWAVNTNTYSLDVSSAYGMADPSVGQQWYTYGTSLVCSITNSTAVFEDTQRWMTLVCTGWTGSGSVPAAGATTNTGSFSFRENSAITWHWAIKDLIVSNQTVTVLTNSEALNSITARDGYAVEEPGNVTFRAGDVIKLEPGFVASTGSVFRATIDPGL